MNKEPETSLNITQSRWAIYGITFLMGGCGIAYEYTFSKIASDLLGNSVRQWAIIIGIMMFCMGVGSDIQKHIHDKKLFDRFIQFEVLLGILGGFGPIFLIITFGTSRDHFALIQYALTIGVGILIGLEIPVLARINERFTPQLRLNIGGILRMDYIGAFVGALAWVFILPRFFTIIQTGFILGLINNVIAGIALLYFVKLAKRKILLSVFVLISISALTIGVIKAPAWTAVAEQKLFMNPIVYSNSTPYQHIVITQHPSGDIRCYINGHLQFSSNDEYIYHELLVHPAMHISDIKKRVLILGGGDGLAVREVLKYSDVESITLVDIDPEMISIAMENPYIASLNRGSLKNAKIKIISNKEITPGGKEKLFYRNRARPLRRDFEPAKEVTVYTLDAAKFVAQAPGLYDVIIMDFPDPNSLELSKLYSKSFYHNVFRKLTRTGIIVQQSSSPYFTQKAFQCIGKTMKSAGFSALPFHENVPSFGEWGWWIGCKNEFMSEEQLKEKIMATDSLISETDYLTVPLLKASFNFGKNIKDYKEIKINSITNNVIFTYYIKEIKKNYH